MCSKLPYCRKVNHNNDSYISYRVISLHDPKKYNNNSQDTNNYIQKNGKRKENKKGNNFTTNTDLFPESQNYIKKIKKKKKKLFSDPCNRIVRTLRHWDSSHIVMKIFFK